MSNILLNISLSSSIFYRLSSTLVTSLETDCQVSVRGQKWEGRLTFFSGDISKLVFFV